MFDPQRQMATFSKLELSKVIYEGAQGLKFFLQRQRIIDNDPVLKFDPATIHRSREEMMTIYAKKLIRYNELMPRSQFSFSDKSLFFYEQMPLSLHQAMFLMTLRNLCDEEQVKMFVEPAERCEILGCYAQTELGHGSDVKSLMTTATYEQSSQSFIVNTPSTKAAKWWIGDLGVFANHAAVFAQLIVKGKNYGIHCFVVPIRDKDHKPLPGVEVGDIGPKMGYNCKDNGYLMMKNIKIPRKNMLMKFQRVSKEGKYEVIGNQKITYATMLKVRGIIPHAVFYNYSKALTIIVRYSLARCQFKDAKGEEMPIMNYQLQQEKIFPKMAELYANYYAYKTIYKLTDMITQQAKEGNFSKLNQAHIITSSIKAICTKDGINGIDILRRAAGGHGYSSYSAIPTLQLELVPTFTFEGDFTILMLQVARYLLKNYNRVHRESKKPLPETVAYLKDVMNPEISTIDTEEIEDLRNPELLLKAYRITSSFRIKKAAEKILLGITSGMDLKKTWDEHSGLELVQASTSHSYLWMFQNFYQGVRKVEDVNTKKALERLLLLYGVEKILEYSSNFFESKAINSTTFKTLRLFREKLFEEIRPDVLTLVEAFEYSDNTLMSAIGRSDGRPYDHLLDWFRNYNDVNQPKAAQELKKLSVDFLKFHINFPESKL